MEDECGRWCEGGGGVEDECGRRCEGEGGVEDECGRRCEGEGGEGGVNLGDLYEASVVSCLPHPTASSTLWLVSNCKILI